MIILQGNEQAVFRWVHAACKKRWSR